MTDNQPADTASSAAPAEEIIPKTSAASTDTPPSANTTPEPPLDDSDKVTVEVVHETSGPSATHNASAFKFPYAGQADIVRATQKDAFYQQHLQSQLSEIVQQLKGVRYYAAHQGEVETSSKLMYYGLTTFMGAQTLGEEYCGILQIDKSHMTAPGIARRFVLVLLQSGAAYGVLNVLARVKTWAQQRRMRRLGVASQKSVVERVLEAVGAVTRPNGLWSKLSMAHLAVFYFVGAYYSISKRLTGIRYVFTRKLRQGEETNGYEILGVLLALQIVVQTAIQLKQMGSQSTQDDEDEDDEDEEEMRVRKNLDWATTASDGNWSSDEETVGHEGEKAEEGAGNVLDEKDGEDDENHHDDDDCSDDIGQNARVAVISPEDREMLNRFVTSEQKCTLCLSTRSHSASTPCGHLFCWDCAFEWCQTHPECPLCRQPVKLTQILPVFNY